MKSESKSDSTFDLLIIGGGIHGVGVARDAAGRGLSVLLCEQDDLGGATSSASSKLLHSGLRYLERYQFRMVRNALAEREVLLRNAPHIIRPLQFVLPISPDMRSAWKLRAGLFLYDHLARRDTLAGSHSVDLLADPVGAPLKSGYKNAFSFSDCWVDDARLVILNAIDARDRGAMILTRTRCIAAQRDADCWTATLLDLRDGVERQINARVVVNAAGPWVYEVLADILQCESRFRLRLVKGSHLVVPRLSDGHQAYILQNSDQRVVFAIPFEREFSIVGTTDVPVSDELRTVKIDDEEIDYLCDASNTYFERQITPDNVVSTFSGIRSLIDDGSDPAPAVSRDYELEVNDDGAVVVTIWGGRLTGYRLVAERVLNRLSPQFPDTGDVWTANQPLPGGNLVPAGFENFKKMVTELWDWLPDDLAEAYAIRYGSRIHTVMGNMSSLEQLGDELSPGLYEREARYLVRHEWAMTAEDILWRRTKLGLRVSDDSVAEVENWITREIENHPVD